VGVLEAAVVSEMKSPGGLGAPKANPAASLPGGGETVTPVPPAPRPSLFARIFVPGEPRAQGSKRGFVVKGRAVLVESAKGLGPWRADIKKAASEVDFYIASGPVSVSLGFILPRPRTASKKLTGFALASKRPDIDKLTRAVLDALTGVWMKDDSQVVELHATKEVAMAIERPGVIIEVMPLSLSRLTQDMSSQ